MVSPDIQPFLDRLVILQAAAVTGSTAYPYYNITTAERLVFTNVYKGDVDGVSTVRTVLLVAPMTSNLQDAEHEIAAQGYIRDVLNYFRLRPSMTLVAEPATEELLQYLLPDSLTVESTGVGPIERDGQTFIGAGFTFRFSVLDGAVT